MSAKHTQDNQGKQSTPTLAKAVSLHLEGKRPEALPASQLSRHEGRSCRSLPLVRAVTTTTAALGATPASRSPTGAAARLPR